MFNELSILNVFELYRYKLGITLYKQIPKFMSLFTLNNNHCDYALRKREFYAIPRSSFVKTDNSLNIIIPKFLNYFHGINIVIFHLSLKEFKTIMKYHCKILACCNN